MVSLRAVVPEEASTSASASSSTSEHLDPSLTPLSSRSATVDLDGLTDFHGSQASPFFIRLVPEIRYKIYRAAFGDRLIYLHRTLASHRGSGDEFLRCRREHLAHPDDHPWLRSSSGAGTDLAMALREDTTQLEGERCRKPIRVVVPSEKWRCPALSAEIYQFDDREPLTLDDLLKWDEGSPLCYSNRRGQLDSSAWPWLLTCRQAYSESIDLVYRRNTFAIRRLMTAVSFPYLLQHSRLDAITSVRLAFTSNEMAGWSFATDFSPDGRVLLPSSSAPSARALEKISPRERYELILNGFRRLPGLRNFYLVIEGAVRSVVVPTAAVTTLSTPVVGNVQKGELEEAVLGPIDAFPDGVEREVLLWTSTYSAIRTVVSERAGKPVEEEVVASQLKHQKWRTRFWREAPGGGGRVGYWINMYG